LTPLYFLVTWCRNILYDRNIKFSKSYKIPVICVGNLSVGGTGKTPMVFYLIQLLKNNYAVATLSRGYKRQTKGFVLADANATVEAIGDEPFEFYDAFGKDIRVASDENRVRGIDNLLQLTPKPNVVLLDDAFQHRKVNAGLNILLTSYHNMYFKDIVLPTGDLREPRSGAKRSDIIIVTKCPESLEEYKKRAIIKWIKPEPHQTVFFSHIVYDNTLRSKHKTCRLEDLKSFTLVTGIADASPLVFYLQSKRLRFKHLEYPDHHKFTDNDIAKLEKESVIVTTKKDFMRLKSYDVLSDKLYYIPIQVNFDRPEAFNALVKSFCQKAF